MKGLNNELLLIRFKYSLEWNKSNFSSVSNVMGVYYSVVCRNMYIWITILELLQNMKSERHVSRFYFEPVIIPRFPAVHLFAGKFRYNHHGLHCNVKNYYSHNIPSISNYYLTFIVMLILMCSVVVIYILHHCKNILNALKFS